MTGALEQYQREFARALRAAEPGARPSFLKGPAGENFRIYRNNYFAALAGRLAEVFPGLKKLLGEAEFNKLAYRYAVQEPPKARSLACFGGEFAAFLARQEGLGPDYVTELANLEYACHRALHAADANPLDPKHISALGSAITEVIFEIHPAAQHLQTNYPVVEVLRVLKSGNIPQEKIRRHPGGALLTRPGDAVKTFSLGRAEERFLKALSTGKTPRLALERVEKQNLSLDPKQTFLKFLKAGVFKGVKPPRSA